MDWLSSDLFFFRWQDAIDIALNSYILFRLYVLFRGTRIFQFILTIVAFWVLQHLATYFGLIITGWLLRALIALAAFIIIIVFRDEVFSILQAKTLRSLFWKVPKATTVTPLDLLADGVFDLAKKRIGALLVIPGKKSLDGIAQGGVPWQGLISREMLLSIFDHNSPVHDGAAIVSSNRISKVGAILPLSTRLNLPTYYGTRHRAAVGLSEASDALVMVVSEERGQVSVAKEGSLEPMVNSLQLRRVVQNHLGIAEPDPVQDKKNRLRMVLAGVICTLLVVSVWYGFTRGVENLVTLEVPVEYTGRDAQMEILYTSATSADVQLGGSSFLIRSIRPDQVKVRVDLARAEAGLNSYPLTMDNVSLPRGVKFKRIEPSSVTVHLDRLVTKTLPVQVEWSGRAANHLKLTEVSLSPETLTVRGASQTFSGVSTLYTEKVSLEGLTRSGNLTTNVLLPQGISLVSPTDRSRVTVTYRIEPRNLE